MNSFDVLPIRQWYYEYCDCSPSRGRRIKRKAENKKCSPYPYVFHEVDESGEDFIKADEPSKRLSAFFNNQNPPPPEFDKAIYDDQDILA